MSLLRLTPGQRMLIVGRTGSGKTQLLRWLLDGRLPTPAIVINTKGDEAFDDVTDVVVSDGRELWEQGNPWLTRDGNVNLIPQPELAVNEAFLDDLLKFIFINYRRVSVLIDEISMVTSTPRAGPGLTNILSRGRSRGITTVSAMQRPVGLPRPFLTETDRLAAFRLIDRRDREALSNVLPNFDDLDLPPRFWFYIYDVQQELLKLHKPVPIIPTRPDPEGLPAQVQERLHELLWI